MKVTVPSLRDEIRAHIYTLPTATDGCVQGFCVSAFRINVTAA